MSRIAILNALTKSTYLNKTGLTGAPNLYTVARDSMNEKKPDMNIVVAIKVKLIFCVCFSYLDTGRSGGYLPSVYFDPNLCILIYRDKKVKAIII